MTLFGDTYRNRRVLVTGHTGFKGSWLSLWLQQLGAKVTGVALAPEASPNHWDLLGLDVEDHRIDIRDWVRLEKTLHQARPEIIFHLAAQPLVRRSYREPLETWSTNVMGTANVLEASRHCPDLRAIVVITTDKCYENREWPWGYRENDTLGGHDPYSASKAAAELVAASYRSAYFEQAGGPLLATARAGNVIGGGDWSEDRLIPDLVRAVQNNQSLEIRSPQATRPWQHVLESLCGYLMLGEKLLSGNARFSEAWNFGPDVSGNQSVQAVLKRLSGFWPEIRWQVAQKPQAHEATLLYLDAAKARTELKWQPVWDLEKTLAATAQWYHHWLEYKVAISHKQIEEYVAAAGQSSASWVDR